MKKQRLFISLLALFTLGFGLSIVKPAQSVVRAEDEITEVIEEEPIEDEPIDEVDEKEDEGIIDKVINEYQEVRETIVEVLNQPLVIGGFSVTLGALVIFVISKLVGACKTKKIKDLTKSIKEYAEMMTECISKKEYDLLVERYNSLIPVLKELGTQVKNVNIKENINAMLVECKPIVDDSIEFAKQEKDKVVDDTKAFVKEEIGNSSIAEILNKD